MTENTRDVVYNAPLNLVVNDISRNLSAGSKEWTYGIWTQPLYATDNYGRIIYRNKKRIEIGRGVLARDKSGTFHTCYAYFYCYDLEASHRVSRIVSLGPGPRTKVHAVWCDCTYVKETADDVFASLERLMYGRQISY